MADNPFNLAQDFNQGAQSGADWAKAAASLSLQKEAIENQKANHQLMVDEHNFNVNKQIMDEYDAFASMPNDSPVKKEKAKQWKANYVQSGRTTEDIADQWIAGANDPKIQQYWNQLTDGLSDLANDQPGAFKKIVSGAAPLFKTPMALNLFKDLTDKLMMMKAMSARNAGMSEARETGAETGVIKEALGDVKNHAANFTEVLRKSAQLNEPDVTNANVKDVLEGLSVANAGFGRGNISDAKMKQIIPGFSGTQLVDLVQYLENKGDEKANPALVTYSKNLVNQMLPGLEASIKTAATTQNASLQYSSPKANATKMRALNPYLQGDFFNTAVQNAYPDGIPDWMKYSPKNYVKPAPKETPQSSGMSIDQQQKTAAIFKQELDKELANNPQLSRDKVLKMLVDEAKKQGISDDVLKKAGLQ